MNPKTICADMIFHHPHDMQAFYQMHNVKKLPTKPHTHTVAKSSRKESSIVQEVSLCSCGYSLEKSGQDYFISNHTSPVDAQDSNSEKHTGNFEW